MRANGRLPPDARHGFGGGAIDRSRPVTLRLDGRAFAAFEGDTVLSALLAAGISTAGTLLGSPVALDETLAPIVAPREAASDPAAWLPMARRPVRAGDDLVTIAAQAGLERYVPVLGRLTRRRSLRVKLADIARLEPAWGSLLAAELLETDTVVVGAGIAGMSAALRAAEAGERVMLIEQRPWLGGDAGFFGRVGEEEPPDERIARLAGTIAGEPRIAVRLLAQALGLGGGRALVHEAAAGDTGYRGRLVRVKAQRFVLATGTAERLPVFAGNRLPGVVRAIACFHRAERFGIWSGQTALVATASSFAYRLAMLAADADVRVIRVVDARPAPQSRFVDFAKATGITLASGLVASGAELRREGKLAVRFSVAIEGATGQSGEIETDLLVAAGGLQPRIGLWLMAGGRADCDPVTSTLTARGEVEGVRLAGAAAGFAGSAACVASAHAAVDGLMGRPTEPIEEQLIDAAYETPPGPTTVALPAARGVPAYFDGGASFTRARSAADPGPLAPAPRHFRPLSIGDVASAVAVGAVAAREAGVVAAERCVTGGTAISDSGWRPPDVSVSGDGKRDAGVPAWLAGRFGAHAAVVRIAIADGRRVEAGCLLHPNSEANDPVGALGVVLDMDPQGAAARVFGDRRAIRSAPLLFVRDVGGAVPVSLLPSARRARRPQEP